MALIKCPECGKEISDRAASCIHCGCPLQQATYPTYTAETHSMPKETVQNKTVRMSQKQIMAVIILTVISVLLPLVLSQSGLYNFRLISFVLSLIPCVAVVLLAVFQPKKKELLCVIALTFSAVINFVVPQFLYREPLTIVGLLNYAVFFSLIIVYWLSAVHVIKNKTVPIAVTVGYALFGIIMVFIASTYGRYMLGIRMVSVICDVAFYSSGCIIICNSMKHRQHKVKAVTTVKRNTTMNDEINTIPETNSENTTQPKKKSYGKYIFLALVVAVFGFILIYNTVIVRTVDKGNGWKHQIGHFGECVFAEHFGCGEATHRIKSTFVTGDQYCEEHWESNGIGMFERLAKKSISGSNKSNDSETDAKICAKKAVEDRLKAPSTADFCSYSEMDATYLGDDRWKITGYVDAENSFGAMVRQNWTVTLTLTASGFTDYDVTFD